MMYQNLSKLALASTIATFGLGLSALSSQAATIINGSFSQTGFTGGGTLTGSFAGTDVNSDGILNTTGGDTLTALTATFSGNGTVNPVVLGLTELDNSGFFLDFSSLGSSSGTFAATNINFFLTNSSNFIDVLFDSNDALTEIEDSNGDLTSSSTLFQVTVTQVTPPPPARTPEPSSILASVVALGLGALSAKRKLQ
ncbi:hypothetical protein PCC8801_1984 [Rippkaea orientalis PCC 8801]|uniref:PEP-CTERM protein-sorting domain-containing protein n=1 Tax=Rippkaea orientalis (strain PCC 8801 / RF-1) TaxID=41431 RepID=B7JYU5_RIPO1|nr:hypothetical protein [Rippkaea orientalis]ACK66022.1 hypothetical protein PCC8801_1984 [Rippkaea orientalis PCC 8801]